METKSHLFIKGPIPYLWLQRANSLGPATGIIAVNLWFYVGINNGSRTFKIDGNLDLISGLCRQTRQRCLKRLHDAGLIELSPRKGAYPFVAIISTGNAGRRNQTPLSPPLETKTFDVLTKASAGTNFRKTNFQKQGYSHGKQITFQFS